MRRKIWQSRRRTQRIWLVRPQQCFVEGYWPLSFLLHAALLVLFENDRSRVSFRLFLLKQGPCSNSLKVPFRSYSSSYLSAASMYFRRCLFHTQRYLSFKLRVSTSDRISYSALAKVSYRLSLRPYHYYDSPSLPILSTLAGSRLFISSFGAAFCTLGLFPLLSILQYTHSHDWHSTSSFHLARGQCCC